MKTTFWMLMLLVMTASASAAEFWAQAQYTRGAGDRDLYIGADGDVSGRLGWYAFGQASGDGYRLAYAGPTLKVASWLIVGVGVGQENWPTTSTRKNVWLGAGNSRVSAYVTLEDGGSGPWHYGTLMLKLSDTWSVGGMEQSFIGRGPRLEYNITKHWQLSGSLLHDSTTGENNQQLAVKITF